MPFLMFLDHFDFVTSDNLSDEYSANFHSTRGYKMENVYIKL